jgi:hypothetical protein
LKPEMVSCVNDEGMPHNNSDLRLNLTRLVPLKINQKVSIILYFAVYDTALDI